MRNITTVLVVAILSATGGCSSKPLKTQKGSTKQVVSEQTNAGNTSLNEHNPHNINNGPSNDQACTGDNNCFTSKVKMWEIQDHKVLREIEIDNELCEEVVNDLRVLREKLASLNGDPNEQAVTDSYSNGASETTAPDPSIYKQSRKNLQSSSSFTNDDSQSLLLTAETKTTPSYFEKFANVVTLLLEQEEFKLKVSGYSDSQLTDLQNPNLLSQPVKESEGYLQIMVELKF